MQYDERLHRRSTHKGPTLMRVKDIEVLIDDNPKGGAQPAIGLQINPAAGASFILPLAYDCAKELSDMIAQTLMLAAPELYFPAHIVKKLKSGKLTYEQLKDLI